MRQRYFQSIHVNQGDAKEVRVGEFQNRPRSRVEGDQAHQETSAPPAPKTAKQLAARRNQEKVKSILLLAIPDEYLLKFHNVIDAKSLWEAIKSRFGEDDLEELDLRWQVAMLTVRVRKFIQKTGRNMDFKEKRPVSLDKSKIECYNCHRKWHFARECRSGRNQGKRSYGDNGRSNAPTNESSSQALVAQDGLGGYDWSNDFEIESVNYALMVISSSSSSSSSDNVISLSVFDVRSSDEESTPANDRFSKADGYHAIPPPITGNFLTPKADILFAGLDEYAIRKKIIESKTTELNADTSKSKTSETVGKTNEANTQKPKTVYESVNKDKVIIEDWNSDDEDNVSEVQTVNP
ncbi:ribonuclease H-like domain-containing protein [Tanacetum coccineum]|uniref:Ribonuclease H-like domain-containing protein n=1 Tax=Tanacetum coccineum TaxID=301880 RepID=A0ABQ4YAS5_9ASTR